MMLLAAKAKRLQQLGGGDRAAQRVVQLAAEVSRRGFAQQLPGKLQEEVAFWASWPCEVNGIDANLERTKRQISSNYERFSAMHGIYYVDTAEN